jgi:hypothetical protein
MLIIVVLRFVHIGFISIVLLIKLIAMGEEHQNSLNWFTYYTKGGHFNCLALQSFDYERTWLKLFQIRVVCAKLDIYYLCINLDFYVKNINLIITVKDSGIIVMHSIYLFLWFNMCIWSSSGLWHIIQVVRH